MDSNTLPILWHNHGSARLEYNKNFAILHAEHLKYFKPSTMKFIKEYLPQLSHFVKTVGYKELYAAAPCDNEKINKLAAKVGFTKIISLDGYTVYRYTGETHGS